MENSYLEGTGLTLQLSPDAAALSAVYAPADKKRPLNPEELQLAISAESALYISQEAVNEVLKRCHLSPLGFTLQIGEKRNATLALLVSDDLMSAGITITPSYGGSRVTVDEVVSALAERGIVFGIMLGEIEAAVEAGRATRMPIAAGIPPRPGEDSQFISLIAEMATHIPQITDEDTADYRNQGDIISVSLGDPLMRRTHPTAGVPGRNLLGVELPASDGSELHFADNLTGIACDLHDCDLVVAAISGFPVLVPRGVIVEPVYKLRRVDLSTGNIHFKGSLEIAGDVSEGMEVTATEQLTVGGIVEAARLKAGGDIEVKGGVIGHSEFRQVKPGGHREMAQLEAGGQISVQFAENAQMTAAQDILIKELAMQCELTSGASVKVGEEGGRKGHIIGGMCRAASLVRAVVLGSRAGVQTIVEVGVDPSLHRKLETVKDAISDKGRLMEELTKTLSYVKENPGSMEPELVRLKERVYSKYQGEIAELTGEKKRLQKRMEINAQAKVVVERDAFLGTQIRIGESTLHIEEDLQGCTFMLGEEGICH